MYSNLSIEKLLDLVTKEVFKQRESFVTIYNTEPRYVKFPIWLVHRLTELETTNISINNPSYIQTFLGLQICLTPKIHKITEIEVF